jgi:hypothetical protein
MESALVQGEPLATDTTQADRHTLDVAWRLIDLSRENVRTLEDAATRIGASQLVGLIALWTQLYTFNETVPAVLAWAALATLILSVLFLATVIMPRQLAKFWDSLCTRDVLSEERSLAFEDERDLVRDLRASLDAQTRRLRRGIRVSIALASVALLAVVAGYAIEKKYRGIEQPSSITVRARPGY